MTTTAAGRHVCVIGAGIVGCASGYALERAGWRVTLVDALPAAGQATSLANGAQLSYRFVEPLASPSTLRSLPQLLLAPDSPLAWRPQARWEHWRWLMQFVLACRASTVRSTTHALLGLSTLSRDTLALWQQELPDSIPTTRYAQPGKLVVYRPGKAREPVLRQLALQHSLGARQRLIDADACVALDPALAARRADIGFGVWTEGEAVVDGAALAAALAQAGGASHRFEAAVTDIESRHGQLRALLLGDERIEAEHFVLAAGNGSDALARRLGLALGIEPLKGYSVTLPLVDAARAPTVSLTDTSRKTVFARLGNELRVAGFAELVGPDTRIDARRIADLCAQAEAWFPGACDLAAARPWAGLRPATPRGLPLIGATPWPNLWLNTGHGGLGLTLAAGSAALLVDLMSQRAPPLDAAPFAYRR